MGTENQMIHRRSEMLARVALTRRLNVDVHPFEDPTDHALDLICTIRDERVQGFLPFGVVVWGTATEIKNADEATAFARQHKKLNPDATFLMPVIILLFSMQNDEAYFAWFVEPSKDRTKLLTVNKPTFKAFDSRELDRMLNRITKWYNRMTALTHAGADEASFD
jgi:hypothetical protein